MESKPSKSDHKSSKKGDRKHKSKNAESETNKVSKDNDMIIESNEQLEIITSFDELNLREELLRGVYAYGFDKPSAVQKRAILPILQNRDVIVQSQSGTGKTCVFSLGAL